MSKSRKFKSTRSSLPNIDFELGKQLVGGDINLAEAVIDQLVETLFEDLKRAEIALRENNKRNLDAIIYYILDEICYCGVPRLKKTTTELYQSIRDDADPEVIKNLFSQFHLAVLDLIMEHWSRFVAPRLEAEYRRIQEMTD